MIFLIIWVVTLVLIAHTVEQYGDFSLPIIFLVISLIGIPTSIYATRQVLPQPDITISLSQFSDGSYVHLATINNEKFYLIQDTNGKKYSYDFISPLSVSFVKDNGEPVLVKSTTKTTAVSRNLGFAVRDAVKYTVRYPGEIYTE